MCPSRTSHGGMPCKIAAVRVMHYLRPTDTATRVVTSTIIVAPAIEPIFGISENTKKATTAEMTSRALWRQNIRQSRENWVVLSGYQVSSFS